MKKYAIGQCFQPKLGAPRHCVFKLTEPLLLERITGEPRTYAAHYLFTDVYSDGECVLVPGEWSFGEMVPMNGVLTPDLPFEGASFMQQLFVLGYTPISDAEYSRRFASESSINNDTYEDA